MGTIAEEFPTKTPDKVIEEIRAKLAEAPNQQGAAYTLIVGAGAERFELCSFKF